MAKHKVYDTAARKPTKHKRYPEALMSAKVERRSPLNDKRRVPSKGRKT